MPKFLIDENLSPMLALFLKTLGYDTTAVRDAGLNGQTDEAILAWAKANKRTIITQDLGFGLVYAQAHASPSIILLRNKIGTTEIFQTILKKLHESGVLLKQRKTNQLVVATEKKIRIISLPPEPTS